MWEELEDEFDCPRSGQQMLLLCLPQVFDILVVNLVDSANVRNLRIVRSRLVEALEAYENREFHLANPDGLFRA